MLELLVTHTMLLLSMAVHLASLVTVSHHDRFIRWGSCRVDLSCIWSWLWKSGHHSHRQSEKRNRSVFKFIHIIIE